ncbi:hypothetical protein B5K11_09585 [Rhizobium leguminosarum bv. trifolii]|uniref:hypothetical protein n=1 Tax=Rhizobium leguminosarum TaxID=384 RepID=UPI000E2E56CC|nr:hypothetical protein [Rhizobium leguminosarum]RFB95197.1 hypothetical protein B5K11_09585 [Rhizobium leguminosarum bv. trifolii]
MQTHLPTTETARAVIGRDIAGEMASFMRAHPGCTYEDLRDEGFTARQIARYQLEAKNLADRLSTRRVA